MIAHRRALVALVALGGLLGGSLLPQLAPATLAWQHDAEHAFARFEADVPLASGCAVWANGARAPAVALLGRSHSVGGCVHSNGGITLAGSRHAVEGTLRHAGPLDVEGRDHRLVGGNLSVTPTPYPYAFDLGDYAPGGRAARSAEAEDRYFVHAGGIRLAPPLLQEGLHYVEGRATVLAGGFEGNVTIVATGTVTLLGAATLRPYVDSLLVHSSSESDRAIQVVAEGARLEGVLVALHGGLSLEGNGNRVHGQLVADRLTLEGADHELLPRTPRAASSGVAAASGERADGPADTGSAKSTAPIQDVVAPLDATTEKALAMEHAREAVQQSPVGLSYGDFDRDGRQELAVGVSLADGTLVIVTGPHPPMLLLP